MFNWVYRKLFMYQFKYNLEWMRYNPVAFYDIRALRVRNKALEAAEEGSINDMKVAFRVNRRVQRLFDYVKGAADDQR